MSARGGSETRGRSGLKQFTGNSAFAVMIIHLYEESRFQDNLHS